MNSNAVTMTPYQQYIHLSRYARYLPEEKRRERWDETVGRYCDFWKKRFNDAFPYQEVFDSIYSLRTMPSMRALMTAGKALERDEIAAYNCSYITVDNPRAFDETLYVLMNGVGLGFSVERQVIAKLPEVAEDFHESSTVIQVHDSKIGWASAYRELISLLFAGQVPSWDLSKLRGAGAPLKTFGGRSSGPKPLEDLFKYTVRLFRNASGRKLTSVECHDLMCAIAGAVIVGGVRRSALISFSNLSDERMRSAKSGQWWLEHGERALANNSVAYTEKPDMGVFMKEWLSLYESKSGERGLFNRRGAAKKMEKAGRRDAKKFEDSFGATNPCGEIFLRNMGLCNLSTVVVRDGDSLDDLKEKVRTSAIIGTFQSTLTNFRYVRSGWKKNADEERLLGVSMTGIMDHPVLSGQSGMDILKEWLSELKQIAINTNVEWAAKLGIEPSVAITTVKPEGCTTPDTKVKTDRGILSMTDIFKLNGFSFEDMLSKNDRTWLVPVTDIKVYDENNDLQDITSLYVRGQTDVYEITFEDGNTYKFTGNHHLKTTSGEWKRVDQLTEQDEIISF